jgi:hypothetical protein
MGLTDIPQKVFSCVQPRRMAPNHAARDHVSMARLVAARAHVSAPIPRNTSAASKSAHQRGDGLLQTAIRATRRDQGTGCE